MKSQQRKDQLLKVAMKLARRKGYFNITRFEVAKEAKVSESLINVYFHTVEGLRNAIVERAIQVNDTDVIAQAVVNKHKMVSGFKIEVNQ